MHYAIVKATSVRPLHIADNFLTPQLSREMRWGDVGNFSYRLLSWIVRKLISKPSITLKSEMAWKLHRFFGPLRTSAGRPETTRTHYRLHDGETPSALFKMREISIFFTRAYHCNRFGRPPFGRPGVMTETPTVPSQCIQINKSTVGFSNE